MRALNLSNIIFSENIESIKKRLFKLSSPEPNTGCFIWTGATYQNGYGILTINKKCISAHRASYFIYNGNIDTGLVIDHLCNNTYCINPLHLEAKTQRKNILRGKSNSAKNAAKTHCHKGHEFTESNTRIDKKGARVCHICIIEKGRRKYQKYKRHILEQKANKKINPANDIGQIIK